MLHAAARGKRPPRCVLLKLPQTGDGRLHEICFCCRFDMHFFRGGGGARQGSLHLQLGEPHKNNSFVYKFQESLYFIQTLIWTPINKSVKR